MDDATDWKVGPTLESWTHIGKLDPHWRVGPTLGIQSHILGAETTRGFIFLELLRRLTSSADLHHDAKLGVDSVVQIVAYGLRLHGLREARGDLLISAGANGLADINFIIVQQA